MKMDARTYDTLEQEMHRMFEVHRDQLLKHWRKVTTEYVARGKSANVAERFRWDAMNALDKWEGGVVKVRLADYYAAGLYSDHIDTALRKVMVPIMAKLEAYSPSADAHA